jgi:hypothetical protein
MSTGRSPGRWRRSSINGNGAARQRRALARRGSAADVIAECARRIFEGCIPEPDDALSLYPSSPWSHADSATAWSLTESDSAGRESQARSLCLPKSNFAWQAQLVLRAPSGTGTVRADYWRYGAAVAPWAVLPPAFQPGGSTHAEREVEADALRLPQAESPSPTAAG